MLILLLWLGLLGAGLAHAQPVAIAAALDEGDYTTAQSGFAVRWVVYDPGQRVLDFEVRGTRDAPDGAEVRPWASAGNQLETVVDDLGEVKEGSAYFFHVRAVVAGGVTEAAVTDGIVVDTTAPTVRFVDDGDYTRADSALAAQWAADDNLADAVSYRVAIGSAPGLQDVAPWRQVGTRESGRIDSLPLTDGATYWWQVEARDPAGNVATGASDGVRVDRTVPVVTVEDQGDFAISPDTLGANWSAQEETSGIAGYRYALGTAQAAEALVPWTETLQQGVRLQGLPLVDGEIYVFRVVAVDGAGNEGFGAADGVRVDLSPPQIQQIAYSPFLGDAGQVTISWFANDPLGVGITEYFYKLGTVAGAGNIVPLTSAGLETGVTMQGLSLRNGRTYWATVVAVDARGRSGELTSGGMLVDVEPPAFEYVTDAGEFTSDAATLRFDWLAVDGESGVTEYEYSLIVAGDGEVVVPPTRTTAESVTLTALALREGKSYRLNVSAFDQLGRVAFAASDGIRLDVTAPAIDYVLDDGEVTARTDRLALAWAASDEPAGVARQEVAFGRAPGSADVVPWTDVGTATDVAFEGLQLAEGPTFYGTVRVTDLAGNAAQASADGIRVDLDAPLIVNPRVDAVTESTATVRWATSKPTTARIDYGPTPDGGEVVTVERLDDAHAVLLTQLERGRTYHLRITATDDGGVSADSGELTFTTLDEAARAQRMCPEGSACADADVLQSAALMTFRTGDGDLWAGALDPATGMFAQADGREHLLATDVLMDDAVAGPRFGLDAAGWAVFYAVEGNDGVQVWRSALLPDGRARTEALTAGLRHQSPMPAATALRTTTRVLNLIGDWGTGGELAWFDETTPGQQQFIATIAPGAQGNRVPGRWLADGRRLVVADSDSGQLIILDADSGAAQVITDDAGRKTAPLAFSAPEFDGATIVAAVIDDSTLGVWREPAGGADGPWPRIATLTIPPEAAWDVLSSPTSFQAAGKSWLAVSVQDAAAGDGGATGGEIWVMDLEPDERFRHAARCDDGRPGVLRDDPVVYVGADEVFVYYDASTGGKAATPGLWRCRTGIRTQTRHPLVDTPFGRLQGVESPLANADAWYGFPYAAPPVDERRFALPTEPAAWDHVRQASRFADVCPQPDPQRPEAWIGREDCLYMNVFAPAGAAQDGAALPVLFFVHGGANRTGSASMPVNAVLNLEEPGGALFDGARLAAQGNIIVVTVNYRLGALGNLASPALAQESPLGTAGNYGMYDLLYALARTGQLIDRFGGDPSRITLAGQSAGAYNVGVLLASPMAAGRFAGAVMQSGVMQIGTLERAQSVAQAFVDEMGLTDAPDLVTALRALPLGDIVLAESAVPPGFGEFTFFPHVDGVLVDQQPLDRVRAGLHNDVPLMLGSNADEHLHDFTGLTEADVLALAAEMVPADRLAELLTLYPLESYDDPSAAYAAMITDRNVTSSIRTLARVAATQSAPVFRYFYSHTLSTDTVKAPGAYHGTELLPIFAHVDGRAFAVDDDDRAVEQAMLALWSRFVTWGNPNVPPYPAWPRYDADEDPYFDLNPVPDARQQLRPDRSDFWDEIKRTEQSPRL